MEVFLFFKMATHINKLKDIEEQGDNQRSGGIFLLLVGSLFLVLYGMSGIHMALAGAIVLVTLSIFNYIDSRYWDLKYYIMKKK